MIEIDWTFFLQFANFIVLLFVLNVLLYRPLRRVMADRKQTIDGSYQSAKDMESRIQEKMERYQAQLKEAKMRGNQEKASFRQEALEQEAKIVGEARESASARLQNIKDQVAQEAASASAALKSETETLAGQIASKVLGRKI